MMNKDKPLTAKDYEVIEKAYKAACSGKKVRKGDKNDKISPHAVSDALFNANSHFNGR